MKTQTAIARFCAIANYVNKIKFKHSMSSDCFCGIYSVDPCRSVDDDIIKFIEEAVEKALEETSK
jgi:hypothetical protein